MRIIDLGVMLMLAPPNSGRNMTTASTNAVVVEGAFGSDMECPVCHSGIDRFGAPRRRRGDDVGVSRQGGEVRCDK